jgi:hypothetical protein
MMPDRLFQRLVIQALWFLMRRAIYEAALGPAHGGYQEAAGWREHALAFLRNQQQLEAPPGTYSEPVELPPLIGTLPDKPAR